MVQDNPHCGFPRFNIEDLETNFKMVIFTPSSWIVKAHESDLESKTYI